MYVLNQAGEQAKLDLPSDVNKDAFSVFIRQRGYQPWFSGTRTPSTKTQFGAYSPISNGHVFYVPYELVMRIDGSGSKAKNSASEKRRKVTQAFSRYSGIRTADVSSKQCLYRIKDGDIRSSNYAFDDWGVEDVNNFLEESRITADEALQESEQYLIGETLATCTQRPLEIWTKNASNDFTYTLRFDEGIRGTIPSVPDVDNERNQFGAKFPWTGAVVMRAAIGSVTNSRPCDFTEIGIKSEVWRQMTSSANFQGHPSINTIEKFEDKGGQITLGTVTKYINRWSFFRLEARALGSNTWIEISDRPFAINGTTPTAQYNTITIAHPEPGTMHEYRFVPVPGSKFYSSNGTGSIIWLKGTFYEKSNYRKIVKNGYVISYTGEEAQLTQLLSSNVEWVFGGDEDAIDNVAQGPLLALANYSQGSGIPTDSKWEDVGADKRFKRNPITMVKQISANEQIWYWKGNEVKRTTKQDQEAIQLVEGGKNVRYVREAELQPYNPGAWETVGGQARLEYGEGFYVGPSQNKQFRPETCVYYNELAGRYEYWWEGEFILFSPTNSGWKYATSTLRFRAQVDECQPGFEQYEDDTRLVDMYEKNGSNLITGARLVGAPSENTNENQYDFYYQGTYIGRARKGDIYIKTNNPVEGRWRLDDKKQDYKTAFYKDMGSFRRLIYHSPPKSGRYSVETGVIMDESGRYSWWHDGELIANNLEPNPNNPSDFTWRDGPIYSKDGEYEYKRDKETPDRPAGQNDRPVWKIKIAKLEPINKNEQWSIRFRYILKTPELCPIRRSEFLNQQDGEFEITKREQVFFPVEADPPQGRLVKVNLREEGRNLAAEDKAVARVFNYYTPGTNTVAHQEWRLESSPGDNYRIGDRVQVGTDTETIKKIFTTVADVDDPDFKVRNDTDTTWKDFIKKDTNYFPLNAISDYFINNTDRSSHQNSPEHEIAFVNEIIKPKDLNVGATYDQMALFGLKITNSKEWSNLSNLSAYISKGLRIERLFARDGIAAGLERPSNLFPEIAYALLTDPLIGAGAAIGAEAVDKEAMTVAARFCHANGFHWDGVIGEQENLREFIFEQAAYCMLDFTIKGGRFALYPAVPFGGNSFKTLQDKKPTVSALFTDGNIRNMEVSFLQPEERQPFQAAVLYRYETLNGFPQTRTKIIRLKGGENDPVEQFDLTAFCTSEAHAVKFAKFALATRTYVTHGIKFETTPTAAAGLEPGQYIRVSTTVTHTSRTASGSIDSKGYIQSAATLGAGSLPIVYWKPDTTDIRTANLQITIEDGLAGMRTQQTELHGSLWCTQVQSSQVRLYKVETIALSEDGLVAVSGSEAPLTTAGTLATVDWNEAEFEEVV